MQTSRETDVASAATRRFPHDGERSRHSIVPGPGRRKGCRTQYGLRGMLSVITLCCIVLATWAEPAWRQRTAVLALRGRAKVYYGAPKYADAAKSPRWPQWVRTAVGDDFLLNVVDLELGPTCGDASLGDAARLAALESLSAFGAPGVTDAGVACLAQLRHLQSIALDSPHLTDKSLEALCALPRLDDLYLRGGRLTEIGLTRLRDRPALRFLTLEANVRATSDDWMTSIGHLTLIEELALENANIGASGAGQLERLARLRVLDLSHNPGIGDDGLNAVGGLRNLEELLLCDTGIGSDGLKHLRHLTKLRILDLSDNIAITDHGMRYLSAFKQLEELKLHATSVGRAGICNLGRLTKLRRLDLSENRAINADAAGPLRRLVALEELDLHNTAASGRPDADGDALVDCLRRLPRLRLVDLSGTGSDTRRVRRALPNVRLIGSRAADIDGAEMPPGTDYRHVCHEARAVEVDSLQANGGADTVARLLNRRRLAPTSPLEYTDPYGRLLHQRTLERTLRRMLSISSLWDVASQFKEQGPVVAAFQRRLVLLPYLDDDARAKVFSDLLLAARDSAFLRRLYSAASDLQFADALSGHVEYLDSLREGWILTDAESEERRQAGEYALVFMRDAGDQLGVNAPLPSHRQRRDIAAIFEQTRERCRPSPYFSCWESWKLEYPYRYASREAGEVDEDTHR